MRSRWLRLSVLPLLLLSGIAHATPAAMGHADRGTTSLAQQTLDPSAATEITLAEALTLARAHNPSLAALSERIRQAEAEVRVARTSYWFTIDGQYTGRQTQTFPDPDIPAGSEDIVSSFSQEDWINQFQLTLTQPLPVFGQQQLSVKAARLALEQARADYDLASQQLREDVVAAYIQTLLGGQVLGLREAEVARNALTLQQAQAKFDAGAVPQFEVLRAEVAHLNARDAQVQAQRQAALALLNFRRLLSHEEPVRPAPVQPPVNAWYQDQSLNLPWLADAALAYALEHRPEMRQLELGEAQVSVGSSLLKRRPSLGVVGNLSFSDQESSFSGSNSQSIMMQLNLPLWDGGRDQAERQAGRARMDEIDDRRTALREVIAVEVQDAVLRLQETTLRQETAARTLKQAREAVRIAQLGYDEGVLVFLDLQEAQDGLLAAELNALEATAGQATAEATLLRAIGLEDPQIALSELALRRPDVELPTLTLDALPTPPATTTPPPD